MQPPAEPPTPMISVGMAKRGLPGQRLAPYQEAVGWAARKWNHGTAGEDSRQAAGRVALRR